MGVPTILTFFQIIAEMVYNSPRRTSYRLHHASAVKTKGATAIYRTRTDSYILPRVEMAMVTWSESVWINTFSVDYVKFLHNSVHTTCLLFSPKKLLLQLCDFVTNTTDILKRLSNFLLTSKLQWKIQMIENKRSWEFLLNTAYKFPHSAITWLHIVWYSYKFLYFKIHVTDSELRILL